MILILSSPHDLSTDRVIDWIDALGGSYVRLRPQQILHLLGGINLPVSKNYPFQVGDKLINLSNIHVVWYRKWRFEESAFSNVFHDSEINSKFLEILKIEHRALSDFFLSLFENSEWLDHPEAAHKSKIIQLSYAQKAGLTTPSTIITSNKSDITRFMRNHKNVITKPIEKGFFFIKDSQKIQTYSRVLTQADCDELPDTFLPSLFQEKIEKQFDLRVFYLDEECWSMAIYSQNDFQTAVDFRKYNKKKPNRTVPFKIPKALQSQIINFMKSMRLKHGSLDLVRDRFGNFYFLEVNPMGQYDMVSHPCNYNLHRRIAEYLISHDHERNQKQQYLD